MRFPPNRLKTKGIDVPKIISIDCFEKKPEFFKEYFNKLSIPIIYNVDIGHVPPQFFIVNGSLATFEYKDGKGKLIQKLV